MTDKTQDTPEDLEKLAAEKAAQEKLAAEQAAAEKAAAEKAAKEAEAADQAAAEAAEKASLRNRARLLGLSVSNNESLASLRTKVGNAIAGIPDEPQKEEAAAEEAPLTPTQIRNKARQEALKLVRIRLVCMNPNKKDLEGEIITVANDLVGETSKYIPYNPDQMADGWHVPQIIYNFLKRRKFTQIKKIRNRVTGLEEVTTRDILEYNIEILPQLSRADLDRLANAQLAAGALED